MVQLKTLEAGKRCGTKAEKIIRLLGRAILDHSNRDGFYLQTESLVMNGTAFKNLLLSQNCAEI